jgi:hypothetical protein
VNLSHMAWLWSMFFVILSIRHTTLEKQKLMPNQLENYKSFKEIY